MIDFIEGDVSVPLTGKHRFSIWLYPLAELDQWKAHFSALRFLEPWAVGRHPIRGYALFLGKELLDAPKNIMSFKPTK